MFKLFISLYTFKDFFKFFLINQFWPNVYCFGFYSQDIYKIFYTIFFEREIQISILSFEANDEVLLDSIMDNK